MIINLTPHPIALADADGEIIRTIAPSGTVARVATVPHTTDGEIAGVPVLSPVRYGAVEGLPAPRKGATYLVSGLVAAHVSGREDVYSPGTAPAHKPVRDPRGRIVAVRCLIRTA